MKHTSARFRSGFSLIELLVVATIMIVLTTVALVSYRSASQNSRNAKRQTDIQTVRQALVLYRSDEGCYPSDSTYLAMIATIDDYISETPYDPSGSVGTPLYTYTPSGSCGGGTGALGFTLSASLEPSSTPYSVTNP
jgi:general secretion pathway protein G